MAYKVFVTEAAKKQLENIIFHICVVLGNEQAAKRVYCDAEATIKRLEDVAGTLRLCEESELKKFGYRKIFFKSHRYIMLYLIKDNTVYIDRIYHELEDYKNLPD